VKEAKDGIKEKLKETGSNVINKIVDGVETLY